MRASRRASTGRKASAPGSEAWRILPLAALCSVLGLASGCDASGRPDGLYAHIHTNKGEIVARLEPELTPLAVANFVGLAEGTIENAAFDPGRPFYDGSPWHRVVPGHVIQTGQAAGGESGGPGYNFPNEIHASLSHDHAGALNQANGGPHTNASQFTITLGDRSYLDYDYIVFGDVTEGLDVVLSIVQDDDVVDSIRIERVGSEAEAYHPTTESFQAMVDAAEARVAEHEVRHAEAERLWIGENWPDAEGPEGGVLTQELAAGSGATSADGSIRVRYAGSEIRYFGHLLGYDGPDLNVTPFGSGADGAPGNHDPPETFTFTPGETQVVRGLAEVLAGMTPGERRVAIVPPSFGYGRGGFYPPEVPGEPRFVISPNSLLVFEIEVLEGEAGHRPNP